MPRRSLLTPAERTGLLAFPTTDDELIQCFGQYDTPVGVLGQFGKLANEMPVISDSKRGQFQPRLQFQQMLAPGVIPSSVFVPGFG